MRLGPAQRRTEPPPQKPHQCYTGPSQLNPYAMPRQSSKWIAALVSLLLIVLYAAAGILSNLLAGHRDFFDYFNNLGWFPILLAIIFLALLIFLLSTFQQRRALAAAYDPDLKQEIQQLIDRLCEEAKS